MIADSDIKALFRACNNSQASSTYLPVALGTLSPPPLLPPPPYFELVSSSGVILESLAREEVEKRVICDACPRTSIIQLCSELSLEPKTIERLLPYHHEGWSRIGVSTIVTTGEFKQLREVLVRELGNQVIEIADFCRRNEIDADLFRKLLPPVATTAEGSWQWLGSDRTWIVGTEFYHARKQDVKRSLIDENRSVRFELQAVPKEESADTCWLAELISQARPIETSTILVGSQLPPIFLTRLVSTLVKTRVLKGTIDGGYYIPETYVVQRQASIIDELHRNGLIATETLRKEGIKDPEQFIRNKAPSTRLLGSHFVTADFIANIEGLVLENIEQQRWSSLKDLDPRLSVADEKALRQAILGDLPELTEVAEKIVSKDLEAALEEGSRGFAVQRAEATWKRRSEKNKVLDVSLKPQELLKHLSVTNTSLPMAVLSCIVNVIHPRVSSASSAHLRGLKDEEIRSAKAIFIEKCYVRFHLHLAGLEALEDPLLKSKLASDLLEYARGLVPTALTKLESVLFQDHENVIDLQQLRLTLKTESAKPMLTLREIENGLARMIQNDLALELPAEVDLGERKRGILEEMQTQLSSTDDPSLMLLLVIIIIHSSKTSSGVLKATGKYVPKLLKDLAKRQQIAETDLNILNSVKEAVIGKKKVGEAESEKLRRIAGSCLDGAESSPDQSMEGGKRNLY